MRGAPLNRNEGSSNYITNHKQRYDGNNCLEKKTTIMQYKLKGDRTVCKNCYNIQFTTWFYKLHNVHIQIHLDCHKKGLLKIDVSCHRFCSQNL